MPARFIKQIMLADNFEHNRMAKASSLIGKICVHSAIPQRY